VLTPLQVRLDYDLYLEVAGSWAPDDKTLHRACTPFLLSV
jgi:hypothetical protein